MGVTPLPQHLPNSYTAVPFAISVFFGGGALKDVAILFLTKPSTYSVWTYDSHCILWATFSDYQFVDASSCPWFDRQSPYESVPVSFSRVPLVSEGRSDTMRCSRPVFPSCSSPGVSPGSIQ